MSSPQPDLASNIVALSRSVVSVIGTGAWGTALAIAAARAGHDVRLVGRCAERAEEIERSRRCPDGVDLPDRVRCVADNRAGLRTASLVILAVPSSAVAEAAERADAAAPAQAPLVVAVKGVEADTGRRMSEVVEAAAPGRPVATLSGPSFAEEVALGKPTTVAVAARQREIADTIADALRSDAFAIEATDDLVGVEIGGAIKNVIAIATGMAEGAELGRNARAALLTKGLAETVSLCAALGGRPETVLGVAGLGDLALTASDAMSRNYSLGLRLGRGEAPDGRLTEGVRNAITITDLARKRGVRLPICETVRAIIHDDLPLEAAFEAVWAGAAPATHPATMAMAAE